VLADEGESTASAEPTTTVQRQHEPGQTNGREPAPAEMGERDARVVAEISGPDMAMTEHSVVIAGGGSAGLMLAGELALAGVDAAIVERRASQVLAGLRAGGLHARTIEVLDQRGIADRFLSQGQVAQVAGFAWIPLDISDFPTRHNYGLALWQNHIERILAEWVGELGVPIYRGREVTGFAQDDPSVDVELSDGPSLRADISSGAMEDAA
jgi:3-(3-hydroxy-phenyl)propionate hydroxylase